MRLFWVVLGIVFVVAEVGLGIWWYYTGLDYLEPAALIVGIVAGWCWVCFSRREKAGADHRTRPKPERNRESDVVSELGELRQRLKDRFGGAELGEFLQDHFNEVYRNHSEQPRDKQIRALLDWCQSRAGALDRLRHLLGET